jgi:hypothetical protein
MVAQSGYAKLSTGSLPAHEVLPQGRTSALQGGEASLTFVHGFFSIGPEAAAVFLYLIQFNTLITYMIINHAF